MLYVLTIFYRAMGTGTPNSPESVRGRKKVYALYDIITTCGLNSANSTAYPRVQYAHLSDRYVRTLNRSNRHVVRGNFIRDNVAPARLAIGMTKHSSELLSKRPLLGTYSLI